MSVVALPIIDSQMMMGTRLNAMPVLGKEVRLDGDKNAKQWRCTALAVWDSRNSEDPKESGVTASKRATVSWFESHISCQRYIPTGSRRT